MSMINGRGFMIWKLGELKPENLIKFVREYRDDLGWLAIKLTDGAVPYNVNGYGWSGNINDLRDLISSIRSIAPRIAIGGWSLVYTKKRSGRSVGYQAQAIANMHQKLGIDFWMLDVEDYGGWKDDSDSHRDDDARILMRNLRAGISKQIPMMLCSYRFPELHQAVPYTKFFTGSFVNEYTAPQVYWMDAHNPVEQLEQTFEQWNDIQGWNGFVPIGPAFKEHGWEPLPGELTEFDEYCADACESGVYTAWGYFDLGEAYYRPEWLAAIFGRQIEDGETEDGGWGVVLARRGLRIRKAPGTAYDVQGWLAYGARIKAQDVVNKGGDIWVKIGDNLWSAAKYNGVTLIKFED